MYKKKPNIKSLAPLRSSDRRRIADQIIKDYDVQIPSDDRISAPINGTDDSASLAQSLGGIRNALLPENSLSARFTTTAGPDLKAINGTIYVGSHDGPDQRVLWIKIEDHLTPTVYTLWQNPGLVPLLHTPEFVIQKLQTGSPLMTPGLAMGPPFPSKARKGAVVAIASIEKPTVPLVVGVCVIDIAALSKVQGAKGHAVRSEHWFGDEIWAWSTVSKGGDRAPEQIDGWMDCAVQLDNQFESTKLQSAEADQDDKEHGGVPLSDPATREINGHKTPGEDTQAAVVSDKVPLARAGVPQVGDSAPFEKVPEKEFTTKDIDQIFWQALLYGLHDARTKYRNDTHHGQNFPISQSAIISDLVLPYFPKHTASQAPYLTMKKTSWKNAKKFLKALEKTKLLKTKDRDGGECVILDINWEDIAITSFVPYQLHKKGSSDHAITDTSKTSTNSDDPSIGRKLEKIAVYRAKESLAPIFVAADTSVKAYHLASEIRNMVGVYIEKENLLIPTNKRIVTLNPVLANSVFDGSSSSDREVLARGTVPRDTLTDRVLSVCSPFWSLVQKDEKRENIKPKAGTFPKVHIILETRTGNKTVTKVSGVETFGITPTLLADALQKSCASSASVGQLVGSSPKAPVMEILVQGPQKDIVLKALAIRGVKKEWTEVVDKTKGKKR